MRLFVYSIDEEVLGKGREKIVFWLNVHGNGGDRVRVEEEGEGDLQLDCKSMVASLLPFGARDPQSSGTHSRQGKKKNLPS